MIQRSQAIVLSRRDFRETSLIVDFYTRNFGKISGLLKGIRLEPEKFASNVEPFSYNEIIFYPKRNSSLHLVSGCDLLDNFNLVRQDIFRIGVASIMTELVAVLMQQEDRNEEVFDLFLASLKELQSNYQPEKIATIFKIKMLALSGFKPHLDSCVACSSNVRGQSKFSMSLGGLICSACYAKDRSARSIFRGTVASILHIEKNSFRDNLKLGMNPQIKRELDIVLNAFLNFHLEKELKSQKVLNKMGSFMPLTTTR